MMADHWPPEPKRRLVWRPPPCLCWAIPLGAAMWAAIIAFVIYWPGLKALLP